MNNLFRGEAAKKITALVIRFRFGILVACIIGYVVLKPRTVPHLSTDSQEPTALSQNGDISNSLVQADSGIQLFDPSLPAANPKWSSPAGLKAQEFQAFAHQVDKALTDFKEVNRLANAQFVVVFIITQNKVKDALWPGVNGQKRKDATLSHDWYELVKVRYEGGAGMKIYDDDFLDKETRSYIGRRLETIQVRVMGGKVLAGDVLCLKTITAFTDSHLQYLQKVCPQLASVTKRISVEFPDLLDDSLPNLNEYFPVEFPSRYRKL